MRPSWRTLLPAFLVLATMAPASARPDPATEARLRDALRTATTQLRALEDEKGRWQASEASLKKELDTLRSRPLPRDGGDRKVADLQKRLSEQADLTSRAKAALEQCQAASRDADASARALELERTRLAAEATRLQERLTAAESRADRMYRVGNEILDWIDALGPGAVCDAREPLLGLKRVELENASQDFRDKLLGQKSGR
jgi:chromosome segregation ATPase